MLFVPNEGDVQVLTNGGIVGTTSPFTLVTSGGTANTYGSTIELLSAASNTRDSWGIEILITGTGASATTTETCVDIMSGAATEDTLISSLMGGWAYNGTMARYFFPLYIPAGTRISARSSSAVASALVRVGIWLYGSSDPPFRTGGRVTTYGTKVNNSRGQAVTPAAGAASVTQLTASSTAAHHYFMPGFQVEADSTITTATWVNIGIGVGAATEERIGTWWFPKTTAENITGPLPTLGAFRDVPSGTRLSMLASTSGTVDAAHGGLIYAV